MVLRYYRYSRLETPRYGITPAMVMGLDGCHRMVVDWYEGQ